MCDLLRIILSDFLLIYFLTLTLNIYKPRSCVCCICFVLVEVLSLKYHSLCVPPGGQSGSPDASFHNR